ncbi:MAG: hypothetical protein ACREMZ_07225 [Gemmatimonadales bacterium]
MAAPRRPGGSFQVVVSAEASPYMAWQAKLAHYSCVTRLDHAPLVVVHHRDSRQLQDFNDIAAAGGWVLRVPSYRITNRGFDYVPRNCAGTLLEAARVVDPRIEWLILCDPDVVFARRPRFGRTLAAAQCGYLDYSEPPVREAMRRLGLAPDAISPSDIELCCGIPYVIPRMLAEPLARSWLEAVDAFVPPRWEDLMYAFGIAVRMLDLRLRRTRMADTNYVPDAPVRAPVLHYCYDTQLWTKRRFGSSRAARRVWMPPPGAKPGTVLAEIFDQLREAHRFYSQVGARPA